MRGGSRLTYFLCHAQLFGNTATKTTENCLCSQKTKPNKNNKTKQFQKQKQAIHNICVVTVFKVTHINLSCRISGFQQISNVQKHDLLLTGHRKTSTKHTTKKHKLFCYQRQKSTIWIFLGSPLFKQRNFTCKLTAFESQESEGITIETNWPFTPIWLKQTVNTFDCSHHREKSKSPGKKTD